MSTQTDEKSFENLIEQSLIQDSGYLQSHSKNYDKKYCLDKNQLFTFLEQSQQDSLEKYKKRYGENYQELLCKRIFQKINQNGIIDTLRKGIKDQELNFTLLYKLPTSDKNQQLIDNYQHNRFSITRQCYYSEDNQNSLDSVIFINGLPIITLELKNAWTNQTVEDAKNQYKHKRDPKEPLFALARCLVHFAVDTDEIYMTTQLNGQKTVFLPFNKGNDNGKGNPPNPNGIKTDYLWKNILKKESLSNILENYVQFTKDKKLIFPRYHQLEVVRQLLAHAKQHNTGQRYLIQHSAGSGKSNSIAWLAHQLVELHNRQDLSIFDSVIVVTDRRVLDQQIRENIKQFSQVNHVVEAITEGSKQLKTALENGKKLIITTIQKFPYIIEEISELTARRFAVIIDEAHSSQSGENASKMNEVLNTDATLETEDKIIELMEKRKLPKNISYFAFTATPKNKTLELFGTKNPDGSFSPFHLYAMKQAIQEEFILDVLKNYTTSKSYYKLLQTAENNPVFNTKKAKQKLKQYVTEHEFTIERKTAVIVDDFIQKTKQINGKARAMVVTSSILSAIKYKFAFDQYLQQTYSGTFKAIVAFSGTKKYQEQEYTESDLNGFESSKIPEMFKQDPYRFLIVAEKFQTGFDEPLLHSLYVDKRLDGVQAVQTLSRLNRAYKPYKHEVFVLDFVNTIDNIKDAFSPYYTSTLLSEQTDPNKLNDLEEALEQYQVYTVEQVQTFTAAYFANQSREYLERLIDEHVLLFKQLEDSAQIDFKVKAGAFIKTYSFLALILPFNKKYWEELYWFLKFLIPKLHLTLEHTTIDGLLDSVDLDSYTQHRQMLNVSIALEEEVGIITPISPTLRSIEQQTETDLLQEIIADFNAQYGNTSFAKNDSVKKTLFEDIPNQILKDVEYQKATNMADMQNKKIAFDRLMEGKIQELAFDFTDLYRAFDEDSIFKKEMLNMIFKLVSDKQATTQNVKK